MTPEHDKAFTSLSSITGRLILVDRFRSSEQKTHTNTLGM
jgi:hypothetical protein